MVGCARATRLWSLRTYWTVLSRDIVDTLSHEIVDVSWFLTRFMSVMKPGMDVRLLVASWPDDAPRGAVTRFCREHRVSRAWFYKVRADAATRGQWGALELRSTRPATSPSGTPQEMIRLLLETRHDLETNGLDHGPLSVQAKLRRAGLQPPSRATIARIFTRAGAVVPEPRKRPRSSFRMFVYPAPNCCWQIDSTEWTLASGRRVRIFQLIDDHSRLALASLVAAGESSEAALQVVNTAISRHGVPQKFLSDNGAAFNPSRRGIVGQLVRHLESLGVVMMTGKPGKPTTQGKNERVHRTLHRYLNARPPATTIANLQTLVDEFDDYYNTRREHQALDRMTPKEAWDATPKASPPTPPHRPAEPGWENLRRTVAGNGTVTVRSTQYHLGKQHTGTTVHVLVSADTVSVFDLRGTEITSHVRAPHGTRYVGTHAPTSTTQPSTTS